MSAPLPIEAIVFDYDDTLAETVPARVEAMRLTFEETGLPYDPAEFVQSMRGLTLKTAFDEMSNGEGKRLDLLAVYRRHYWGKEPGLIYLYDGVREMLDALKRRGMPMGILTSKAHDIVVEGRRGGAAVELEELGVDGHFLHTVGFEDVTHAKPHPEGLLRLIERLDANPCPDARGRRQLGGHSSREEWRMLELPGDVGPRRPRGAAFPRRPRLHHRRPRAAPAPPRRRLRNLCTTCRCPSDLSHWERSREARVREKRPHTVSIPSPLSSFL